MTVEPAEAARWRQAFAATSRRDVPREDCPSAEQLWKGVRDELPRDELLPLLKHVAACPVCTEAWRLGQVLEDDPDAAGAGEVRELRSRTAGSSGRRWRAWLEPVAVAAVLVLAVGFAVWRGGLGSSGSAVRGSGGPEAAGREAAVPEAVLEFAEGLEILPRDAFRVHWKAIEGATYDLEVRTAGGSRLSLRRGLERAEHTVPPADLAGLPSGTSLVVEVTARGSGQPLKKSLEVELR